MADRRRKPGFETLAIHAGQEPEAVTGAVVVPIFQTSTFAQEAVGKHTGYDYARTANPTRTALETCLAALEGARWGLAFSSGMAASDAVAHLLSAADHVVGGALVGNEPELRSRLAFVQNAAGGVPGPLDAWLVLRGAKTLALRMERHSANAQAVAIWLHEHPKVLRVNYPGLASHPHHDLARRQMREFGGMVSFELRGGEAAAKRMAARAASFTPGESLRRVEAPREVPLPMTHASVRGTKLAPPAGRRPLAVGSASVRGRVRGRGEASLGWPARA